MAGFQDFLRNNSPALMQAGAGLLGGQTGSQQAAQGFMGFAQGRQQAQAKNKSLEFLSREAPDLIPYVQGGMAIEAALTEAYKRKQEAARPQNPWVATGGGLFNKETNEWNMPPNYGAEKLPASAQEYEYAKQQGFEGSFMDYQTSKKGGSGFEVTLPDGTSVRQGAFGNQDQKNVANRVTDAQDTAATGTALKQTAAMLRQANANVGYSGVGGDVVGTVLDATEQMGMPIAGKAGARAQMRSGGLDVALAQVQKTKGAISNAEMNLFMSAAPGLKNTPQGNAALIDIIDKVADRQIKRAGEMEKWRQQYGTLDGFEPAWAQYIEQNPLITQETLGVGGNAGHTGGVVDYREFFGGN